VPEIEELVRKMRANPRGMRFADVCRVCDHYFGRARQQGSSHRIYKTPWQGDPRVNIQTDKGMAKAYQIRQVLRAVERISCENNGE
jgi:hypothetical protein